MAASTIPEPRSPGRSRGLLALFAALVAMGVLLAGGCGVSSKKLATGDKISHTSDTASSDTASSDTASSDMASSDTMSTDTMSSDTASSDTMSTDTMSSDTASSDTTTGGTWPAAVRDQFVTTCADQAAAALGQAKATTVCECVVRAVEPKISVADLERYGMSSDSGSEPGDMRDIITTASTECALDPTSH